MSPHSDQPSFWDRLDALLASCELVIDRPAGSCHPRYPGCIYPLDYGYLAGTTGGDGHEIDVWRGSQPGGRLEAILCTVDSHKRDAEVKLLLGCTLTERQAVLQFQNEGDMAAIIIDRPAT